MALAQQVEDTLKRLVRQTLVQKNGDIYVFLTDEEQEINRAIESQNVDSGEVIAKVSEMIFDGLYDEKKYRYPAFNGRYAFAFNQVVDDKPYKANQNNDITLKILTPNSDERADEATMRILSGQSSCVLVVLPDDRTFLDEIRSALQIEKFIRFDATNTVTQFESIKEAKKVEMRERNGAAKLFLSESLKNAEIYVNGDKIQSGAKEIASKINEALGKLVSTVYHKLSYIDTAMSESDIHTLFKNNGQQLTLVGTNITKNELALYDVNDYIALNTQRHMKTSMKSILERFLKAPYGFVEADVQWLVAKLFKNGEIAMFVNNDAVTLLSKTSEEIIRYLTRKEFNEKLMTEKRVKANEKQKKSVRTVMKELFNVTSASDDDDAIMRSFLGYASNLKNDLEKLDIHYATQTAYPGKQLIASGKKLMADVLQMKYSNEFFAGIDRKKDDFLDFAEDYEPVKKFFAGEQKGIEYSPSYDVLVDGKACSSTEQREAILKEYKINSKCVQFDSMKTMKQADLRSIFTGQDVVYIYHNQIDARGDKAASENEVFTACEEAIEEIYTLIKRIASQANTYHFIVTADHGFIYKRDKIQATDKIAGAASKSNSVGQRYSISAEEIKADGVCHTTVGKVLGSADERIVSFPLASDIFKVAGAGQNYVHGGCSPQEMLVPMIDVKVDKGKKETSLAEIALVSLTSKITNLITTLDFVQTEPVSDIVKETSYRVYFISDSNEKISNENIVIADKKDKDTTKRMFRLRFNFKNKKYDKSQKYYLVAYDDKNDIEVLRHEIIMDIAFADDFGFFT